MTPENQAIVDRLQAGVLTPLKQAFIGKDDIVDLMSLCLIAGENLFILGPPGTAKSALVHELGKRIDGRAFEYLLTRFTEPNELFGPFDIRKLREGVLETNTEGMLPEASLVFLDELLNANSAILNSLLTVLNEKKLRRGRETMYLPILMAIGASNHLPEDDALRALFDRFLLRVRSDNVGDDHLAAVLQAGWSLEKQNGAEASITIEELESLRNLIAEIDLTPVLGHYVELVTRLRKMGIPISDRRAVKIQRLIAASAILCQRQEADLSDLWVLEHIWDIEEQRELLRSAVREILNSVEPDTTRKIHPRSQSPDTPDPDALLTEIENLNVEAEEFRAEGEPIPNLISDRLSAIEARIQWLAGEEQRRFLSEKIAETWTKLQQPG
ncbi:MAG: MoxR-like ATPase [Verrucomicrobiales bacterium]|jgi:MoxR-like ATPase